MENITTVKFFQYEVMKQSPLEAINVNYLFFIIVSTLQAHKNLMIGIHGIFDVKILSF